MPKQFDVFPNPNRAFALYYPYIVVLQADVVATERRKIVAPLYNAPTSQTPPAGVLTPKVMIAENRFYLLIQQIATVEISDLKTLVTNIVHMRDKVTRGLDLLFQGV